MQLGKCCQDRSGGLPPPRTPALEIFWDFPPGPFGGAAVPKPPSSGYILGFFNLLREGGGPTNL